MVKLAKTIRLDKLHTSLMNLTGYKADITWKKHKLVKFNQLIKKKLP